MIRNRPPRNPSIQPRAEDGDGIQVLEDGEPVDLQDWIRRQTMPDPRGA